MAIHNCAEIGENLQQILVRLMANDDLVKLLYYEDINPLNNQNLTTQQKNDLIFNKLMRIVPFVQQPKDSKSVISIRVDEGAPNANTEFVNISIVIEVFVPWTNWLITGNNLRPFAIMGEIQKSLNGKKVNGLGAMEGGAFKYSFGTTEMSCYAAHYAITSYA